MIEQQATVRRVHDGLAEVEVERRSACNGCNASAGCGTSVLAGLFGRKSLRVWLNNDIAAEPGDRVIVGLRDEAMLRMSFQVYLMPILALLAGGIIADVLFPSSEAMTLVGAALGLGSGLLYLKESSRGRQSDSHRMIMLRKEPSFFHVVT